MRRARATIRIDFAGTDADPEAIMGAVTPDDTAQMTSRLGGEEILETQVERDSVGGLRSTIDDYVVNCRVAARVAVMAAPAPDTDDSGDDDHDS